MTQNIVAVMGVIGIKGTFQKSAELILDILKRNQELLISVLMVLILIFQVIYP